MRPDDQIRLRHLTEPASKAVGYCAGRQRADLDSDELLRLAVTKLVEIVGEAAKHISPELRAAAPDVPWAVAARMRDRLVHHYFDINLDILWRTVTEELPSLLETLPPVESE
ncbi:HepT-like ribonuclease domain-containing protein [Mycobacterium sp.]|uniref:HepT-like ribonuclease domain-containing protein n=1 Tax=Mycobacterium sp. TaxID=1785 RepID=UPI003D6BE364